MTKLEDKYISALLDLEQATLALDDIATPTQITGIISALLALLRHHAGHVTEQEQSA